MLRGSALIWNNLHPLKRCCRYQFCSQTGSTLAHSHYLPSPITAHHRPVSFTTSSPACDNMSSISAGFIKASSSSDSLEYSGPTGSEVAVRANRPIPFRSQQVSIELRSFEFINNEDKDGTRRAKSHAVKDFKRRQRAEGARYQRLRDSGSKKIIAANPHPSIRPGERLSHAQTREKSTPAVAAPSPVLLHVTGTMVDPFSQFPIQLNSNKDLGLIHHCRLKILLKLS